MDDRELTRLLQEVVEGAVHPTEALAQLKSGPFRKSDLGFATLDHHRGLRHGLSEVVYGESKTAEQIVTISEKLAEAGRPVLITRLSAEKLTALTLRFPEGRVNELGRTFLVNPPVAKGADSGEPYVAVVAAGTSDCFVTEEAVEVCVAMDVAFERVTDVGITGLHRLLAKIDVIQKADAIVAAAGMEGALPSVIGGLVGRPVFAVPTSVGYGASFGGMAALLAMLNSCAPGVTVVNIDNGFSAAFAACQVVRAILARAEARANAEIENKP